MDINYFANLPRKETELAPSCAVIPVLVLTKHERNMLRELIAENPDDMRLRVILFEATVLLAKYTISFLNQSFWIRDKINLEDILLELWNTCLNYDPSKAAFSTYVVVSLRRQVTHEYNLHRASDLFRLPRNVPYFVRLMTEEDPKWDTEEDRAIAAFQSIRKKHQLIADKEMTIDYLNDLRRFRSANRVDIEDAFDVQSKDSLDDLQWSEFFDWFVSVLGKQVLLDHRELAMGVRRLRLFLGRIAGFSLSDMATHYDITRERARQLFKRACKVAAVYINNHLKNELELVLGYKIVDEPEELIQRMIDVFKFRQEEEPFRSLEWAVNIERRILTEVGCRNVGVT